MTNINKKLCQLIVARMEGLDIKGPKRQADAALHMLCGAIAALETLATVRPLASPKVQALIDKAKSVHTLAYMTSVRGLPFVREIAEQPDDKPDAEAVPSTSTPLQAANREFNEGIAKRCREEGRRSLELAVRGVCIYPSGTLEAYAWNAGRAQDVRSAEQLVHDYLEV